MPCFKPLPAFRHRFASPDRPRISFSGKNRESQDAGKWLHLPCGQCIGCRLERSRRWAVRLMHESTLHEKNSFLTLTYDESHVPINGSLNVKHFQDFMKRLRKASAAPLRFFHCGEYGERRQRPHYHCILFGEDFSSDRREIEPTQTGLPQFASDTLSDHWGMGRCTIGEVTFESAAYVARYCLKKITGADAPEHYQGRKPEYVTMSRRPGIGKGWVDKWGLDNIYRADQVVVQRGDVKVAVLPPPFYDKLLEKTDPRLYQKIKREREKSAPSTVTYAEWYEHGPNSPRSMVREEVKKLTIKGSLKRGIE